MRDTSASPAPARVAVVERTTRETTIAARIELDTPADADISTGLGFFDHMLTAFALHARVGLTLACRGDLQVDDHHTMEDCAIVVGAAVDRALGDRSGIARFGSAYAPLDEALARAVVDLSGRPAGVVNLDLKRDSIGGVAAENLEHFFVSFSIAARAAVHIDVIRGVNDHHKAEAAFKAFAIACRGAFARDGAGVPSTKGSL